MKGKQGTEYYRGVPETRTGLSGTRFISPKKEFSAVTGM